MTQSSTIRDLVESIVAQTMDAHVRPLHDDIVEQVVAAVEPVANVTAKESSTPLLRSAIAAIENATQQTDILVALLDGTTSFSGRAALLILRGTSAVGWQARGFDNNDVIKTVKIDVSSGVIAGVVQQCSSALIAPNQFDVRFFATFGAPARDEAVVVPLVVRDKVAAVVYADSGTRAQGMDAAAIELLVRAAGSWIELHALRKAAGLPAPMAARSAVSAVPGTASGLTTQNVAPAPSTSVEAVRRADPEPTPVAERSDSPAQETVATPAVPVRESEASASGAAPGQTATDDEELHRKARRFAKLLVDEIVLYNRDKVSEGKLNKDLYDRLREDIDKSRSTYDRRYGQTSAGSQNYFSQALVAGLADSNAALLGSNFPG